MYLGYSRPLIYQSPFANSLEGVIHHPRVASSLMFQIDLPIVHPFVVPGPSGVVLSLWRRDRNRMDSYRVSTVDVLEYPMSVAQEVHDSSGVTPCILMNNDEVLYYEVSSFSPDRCTKVVLQEHAVVGRVYRLPWRYSVVHYCPINVILHNEHHLHSTLCRAHFLRMRRTEMLPFT